MKGYIRRIDWLLFTSVLLLVSFGLLALYSTSLSSAVIEGGTASGLGVFWKQVIFAGFGVALVFIIPAFNYHLLAGFSRVAYGVAIALLIAVLFFGATIRGTTGWFSIAGFRIQPVELVKFLVLIFLARFFADHARDPGGIRQIVVSGTAMVFPVVLVVVQPDMGSALLLLGTWGALLLMSGVRRRHLIVMILAVVVASAFAWMFVLKPYQKERIAVFWDADRDPLGRGYNVSQSIIAVGSGGVFGKGLGFGSQSQLRFLPERQTDFIFAVIAEELGFVGVVALIIFFGVFSYRVCRIAARADDDFTLFLTLGILFSILMEVAINIGGNLRMLPMTGVTLPFLSYGGSSLLTKFFMVGVLQSIAVRQ